MKNIIKTILASVLIFYVVIFASPAFAQDPPPPPNGGHGGGGSLPPGGGGAPIGEGIFIFSLLAAGYGGIKTLKNRKITPQGE